MTETATSSYGIILYHINDNGVIKYLLYQRRDSYEYMDIVTGAWKDIQSPLDAKKVIDVFNQLSNEERHRVNTYDFDELWNDLWIIPRTRTKSYALAKTKFSEFKKIINTVNHDDNISVPHPPVWGFPKGKKQYKTEPDVKCALRELAEEININDDTMKLVKIIESRRFTETYTGSNGVDYVTIYFLAQVDAEIGINKKATPGCIRQFTVSNEAADAKWMTYDESRLVLDAQKDNILRLVNFKIASTIVNETLEK